MTLLAQASLPLKFWPDAFSTTVYLINRLPTKALKLRCPMEVMFDTKPDYKSLKNFGCLCFPHLRPYNSHKIDFRSSLCTFLGYATNQKGYKCLDRNGRIYISRHVIINEKEFSFRKIDRNVTQKVYNPRISIPVLPCQHESINQHKVVGYNDTTSSEAGQSSDVNSVIIKRKMKILEIVLSGTQSSILNVHPHQIVMKMTMPVAITGSKINHTSLLVIT